MSAISWLSHITQGWTNLIWENPEIEKIAHKRAEICATSGENGNPCERLIAVKKRGILCGKCYCLIEAKVRTPGERCPIGKWEQEKI